MKRILKTILLIIGIAVLTNGIALSFTSNFNLGIVLTILLGCVLIFWYIFWGTIIKALPKWFKAIFIIFLVFILSLSSFLFCYGKSNNVTYKEDAIVVLGAGIHGERPSQVLADRLKSAIEYHEKNPDCVIVVSGGQGRQESISEALAMERYLLANGIPSDKIIKEDKSTSTFENFVNSKAILDDTFDKKYSVAFITNEYHVYRARGIAKSAGLNTTHYHSSTRWYSVLPGTLRECLAVMKFWVFKN